MSTPTPGSDNQNLEKMPGHWLLARMGKRVLRPGGRELTNDLLSKLDIGPGDYVVELAPGMGATAKLILQRHPAGYTGIERDEKAAARVNDLDDNFRYRCIVSTAQDTGLSNNSAHVVVGEAFLTMQSEENKQRILDEAYRILRPGGRLGIHELSLRPASLDPEIQKEVRGDLTRTIHVGARPLTSTDWQALIKRAGFKIRYESDATMRLLEPSRLIKDEGFARTIKIIFNIIRTPVARRRIRAMRGIFRRHSDHLGAIAIVADKPKS